MTAPYADRFVTLNGLRLHYQEWGRRGSPAVLLVHGWSTSAPVWHEIAEALSPRCHVIVPDNRGNGESETPAAGFRIRDYAEDLIGLMEAADLVRPAMIGSSWGANIGTYAAAEHPGRFSKVVLADPVYWKMIDAFASIVPGITSRLERPEADVRAEALAAGAAPEKAERQVYVNYRFSPDVLRRVASENRDWALACEDYLGRVAVPTLLLVADPAAGGYISKPELRHLRAVASSMVETRLWKGVGHLMHAEAPDRFVTEVRAFLETG